MQVLTRLFSTSFPCRFLAWTFTALPMPMLQRRIGHRRKRVDDIFLFFLHYRIYMIFIKTTARNRSPQQSQPPCINSLQHHQHHRYHHLSSHRHHFIIKTIIISSTAITTIIITFSRC